MISLQNLLFPEYNNAKRHENHGNRARSPQKWNKSNEIRSSKSVKTFYLHYHAIQTFEKMEEGGLKNRMTGFKPITVTTAKLQKTSLPNSADCWVCCCNFHALISAVAR